MSESARLESIVKSMSVAARQAVLADPELTKQLIRIYRQNSDRRGGRGEVRCLPSLEFHRQKTRR